MELGLKNPHEKTGFVGQNRKAQMTLVLQPQQTLYSKYELCTIKVILTQNLSFSRFPLAELHEIAIETIGYTMTKTAKDTSTSFSYVGQIFQISV